MLGILFSFSGTNWLSGYWAKITELVVWGQQLGVGRYAVDVDSCSNIKAARSWSGYYLFPLPQWPFGKCIYMEVHIYYAEVWVKMQKRLRKKTMVQGLVCWDKQGISVESQGTWHTWWSVQIKAYFHKCSAKENASFNYRLAIDKENKD